MRKHLNMVYGCEIMTDELNMSDHNAIRVEIIGINNLQNYELAGEKINHFTNLCGIIKILKINIKKLFLRQLIILKLMYQIIITMISYVNILIPICKIYQSCFCTLLEKQKTKSLKRPGISSKLKLIWTDELQQTHERLWKYHAHYKSTGCEKSKFLWKFFKDKMRSIEKNELN
jgi:hypothetical protein